MGTLREEDEQDLMDLEETGTSSFPQNTVHMFRAIELAACYNDHQLRNLPGPRVIIHCEDTKKISTQTLFQFKSPAPIYMKQEGYLLQLR
ncbi:hypothetical protein DPMN_181467 [Dreissena polymorpha]|uniref:Uncharacterized protein n=1 Tax=Dreissena polymorpha TaxID=45954 RepID=A0A9D4DDS6_DREPO|nr:hypothetical protein DPMN_181467 [Dreissena polymorpha]